MRFVAWMDCYLVFSSKISMFQANDGKSQADTLPRCSFEPRMIMLLLLIDCRYIWRILCGSFVRSRAPAGYQWPRKRSDLSTKDVDILARCHDCLSYCLLILSVDADSFGDIWHTSAYANKARAEGRRHIPLTCMCRAASHPPSPRQEVGEGLPSCQDMPTSQCT